MERIEASFPGSVLALVNNIMLTSSSPSFIRLYKKASNGLHLQNIEEADTIIEKIRGGDDEETVIDFEDQLEGLGDWRNPAFNN